MLHTDIVEKIGEYSVLFLPLEKNKLEIKNNIEVTNKTGKDKDSKEAPRAGSGASIQGGGVATFIRTFKPLNREDTGAIQSFLEENTEITIIEKFLGILTVIVNKFSVEDSDQAMNQTLFKIECVVKEAEWAGALNITSKVTELKNNIKTSLETDVNKIAELAIKNNTSVKTISEQFAGKDLTEAVNTAVEAGEITQNQADRALLGEDIFFSKELNYISDSFSVIFDVIEIGGTTLSKIQGTTDRIKTIQQTVKTIVEQPKLFYESAIRVAEDIVNTVNPQRIADIFEAYVNESGTTVRGKGYENLGNLEQENVELGIAVANTLNKVKLISDLTKLEVKGFVTREELEILATSIIERLENIGISYNDILEQQTLIMQYVNDYDEPEPIVVRLKTPMPLLRFVYDRYGNLDYFDKILHINNIHNISWITGSLRVPV